MTETPKSNQAMIDAYDGDPHLTLARRGFITRLTGLAGAAAAAATIMPMIAASSARAAMIDPQDPRLTTLWATYPAGGTDMRAYVAKPAEGEGPFPGVMVIHENRGLNAH